MKRLKYFSLCTCLAFAAPAAVAVTTATPAIAQAKSGEYAGITWKRIKRNGSKITAGSAVVTLDYPIDTVVEVVADYDNYHRFMPNFKKSKVLAKRGKKAMIYLEVGIMKGSITLWGQMRMSEKPKNGETRIIVGKLMDGNMEHFDARWELTPTANGKKTKVKFDIFVDPDMPLPSSVFSFENEKAARRTLKALRERIEKTTGA